MRAGICKKSLRVSSALAALAIATAGRAQDRGSVSDYRLPDPNQTTRPRPPGPSDPDNPYAVPTVTPRAERTAAPAPAPSPGPTPRTAPRIVIAAPAATAADPAPRPRATPRPTPSVSETLTPPPTPTVAPSADLPLVEPGIAPPESVTTPVPPPTAPASEGNISTWLIAGVLAVLALALCAILFSRRRKGKAIEDAAEPTSLAPPEPAPEPASETAPRQTATPPHPAAAATIPAPATAPTALAEPLLLHVAFSAKAVRLSLVYATLQYELEVANAGSGPMASLQVRADLTSAHASIPARDQLAPAPELLEVKHTVSELAPGETAMLKGEVRVPLQQIQPLVKGTARFFVPLARFCFVAPDGAAIRRVFTVGPIDTNGGSGLASVRLDAGPRNLRILSVREIEAARGFSLDPAVAHS